MKLHKNDSYRNLVFRLIKGFHSFEPDLVMTGLKQPVIGYGFNLRCERHLYSVLKAFGFDINREILAGDALAVEFGYIHSILNALIKLETTGIEIARSNLEAIMLERYFDDRYNAYPALKRRKHFAFYNESECRQTIEHISEACELMLDYWLLTGNENILTINPAIFTHDSNERAALVSMVARGAIVLYEDGNRSLEKLHAAILENNRTETWFQIRYQSAYEPYCSRDSIKYAYYESELFGLYDSQVTINAQFRSISKSIYQMYNTYREHIIAHERDHAMLIGEANVDFNLKGGARIKTIEESFKLAYDTIRTLPNKNLGFLRQFSCHPQTLSA